MSQVTRTPEAEQDLLDILAYLAQHSSAAAGRVAAEIDRECQLLARFPLMGTASDFLSPGLRRRTVGRYEIFYRPLADGIDVIRVLHGARDFPAIFNP